jgi:C-terminal processing protease CtpA/Prc
MNRKTISSAFILVLGFILATLTLASEEYKCTATTQECLDKMVKHYKNTGWLGVYQSWDQDTHELEIRKVVADSPASRAGFKAGDRVVAMNNLAFTPENEEKLGQLQKFKKPGTRFTFTVVRGDMKKKIAVTLGRMPEDVIATAVGRHMLEHVTPEGEKNAKKEDS